jgi:hypothetical protein
MSRRPALAAALLTLLTAAALTGCGGSGDRAGDSAGDSASDGGAIGPAGAPPGGVGCPAQVTRTVRTADELTAALADAAPGTVIALAPGRYPGGVKATAKGTAERPITLCGPRDAVVDGVGVTYAVHLDGAAWWRLTGFTVHGGQKGVMADAAQHDLIEGLVIEDVGDEGLHLRRASSDNVVRGNTVRRTGQRKAQFGEGLYVGSAESNWSEYTGGEPDRSDRNLLEGNTISETTAEAVDIKEGTTGGVVRGNTFVGPGSETEPWVNVKGNRWQIIDNTGRTAAQDGFKVVEILDGWGLDNVFDRNIAVVNGPGYGINVTRNKDRNRVSCANRAEGAGKGLTNVTCG